MSARGSASRCLGEIGTEFREAQRQEKKYRPICRPADRVYPTDTSDQWSSREKAEIATDHRQLTTSMLLGNRYAFG
ncbi:hypothetical protein T06_12575 [Trichinella sp. T6]|nr:hypothetical protein T06_12575 [Trichinella sp. T6]